MTSPTGPARRQKAGNVPEPVGAYSATGASHRRGRPGWLPWVIAAAIVVVIIAIVVIVLASRSDSKNAEPADAPTTAVVTAWPVASPVAATAVD